MTRAAVAAGTICTLQAPGHALAAQTTYGDLDAGHPLRTASAIPVPRYAIELMIPAIRLEHLDAGVSRWRFEPGIAYGILPRTEIELHTTFVYREATAQPRGGLAGFDAVVLHALNTESLHLPALAVAGEIYAPFGNAGSGSTALALRALVTRSGRIGRMHLNASIGSYNVAAVHPADVCFYGPQFNIPCDSTGPVFPFIPDGPCLATATLSRLARCGPPGTASVPQQDTVPVRGTHWLVAIAFDHAFALRSLLFAADLYAERFVGLYPRTDWTIETGIRRLLSPTVVLDAGIGRHFAGSRPSWIVTLGGTWVTPLPLHGGGSP